MSHTLSYVTYIIRGWEEAPAGAAEPVWRFRLQDAESGAEVGFADIQALLSFLSLMVAGFAGTAPASAPPPHSGAALPFANLVELTAEHRSFAGPAETASGWTTVRLKNESHNVHFATITRMPEVRGVADHQEIICYVKTDRVFHSFNPDPNEYGMVHELTVTEASSGAEPPRPTLEMTLSTERGIEIADNVRPGLHTVAVHFESQTVHGNFVGHDVHLARLDDNTDLQALQH